MINAIHETPRCAWVSKDKIYQDYHDNEWGIPVHDDKRLFEFIILESFQAGLSWLTVLKKRENFRIAFSNFDAKKISVFGQKKFETLMIDQGIIRNRLKIAAAINNAKCFLEIQKEFESFDNYVWGFVGGIPIINYRKSLKEIPAKTPISDLLSKDLAKRGFKFLGSTTCYAFMQAVGMVNDHSTNCWKSKI